MQHHDIAVGREMLLTTQYSTVDKKHFAISGYYNWTHEAEPNNQLGFESHKWTTTINEGEISEWREGSSVA